MYIHTTEPTRSCGNNGTADDTQIRVSAASKTCLGLNISLLQRNRRINYDVYMLFQLDCHATKLRWGSWRRVRRMSKLSNKPIMIFFTVWAHATICMCKERFPKRAHCRKNWQIVRWDQGYCQQNSNNEISIEPLFLTIHTGEIIQA